MSKNTTTIPFSTPTTLAKKIDQMAEELNISRSALLTAMISVVMNWNETEYEAKKIFLSSLYGKKV